MLQGHAMISMGQHGRNLILRNPLIAGPGTIGYGREAAKLLPLQRLGALITNTTTLHARSGSRQPRLLETPAGVLLASDLQNPGLRTVFYRQATAWSRMKAPIILSLAAEDSETFAYCAEIAEEEESIAGLALEPDLLVGGADMVRVIDVIRGLTSLPIIAHVPVGPAQAVADAVVDLAAVGCDAMIVGSPWPGLVMDTALNKPQLVGGIAGPAIRPLALRLVYDVAQLLGPERLPLIAAGGISSPGDVSAFLAAGAAAVQLDTVMWLDPASVQEMADAVSAA
jgi:dihydroorotate dehydrogenase (NAD+) catalytic subunit